MPKSYLIFGHKQLMEAQYVKELSMELLRDGEGERPMQEPWNTFQNNFLRAIRDHQWD